ncbi:acetolactate decarboxylase [Marivirga sp.]|uniref:acetolactate decarboxylase n=1 Tax=Marivirga sp. TaxID=2018662 RepID=UPI003DA717EA
MQKIFIILIVAHLLSCSPSEEKESYWLKYARGRDIMLQEQDFSARADLDSLKNIKGLMALGPIEDLKGEITIFDGTVYTGTIENDQAVYRKDSVVKAVFLAYGSADVYSAVQVEESLKGLKKIEDFIRKKAIENGLDHEKSFPFYMEAQVEDLDYHIMFKEGEGMHGHQAHQKAKRKFKLNNANVKIVGVWANSQEDGIYTHNGSRIHLHFINEETLASGHIDDVQLLVGSKLFLPQN